MFTWYFKDLINKLSDVLALYKATWSLSVKDNKGNEWIINSNNPRNVIHNQVPEFITISENVKNEKDNLSPELPADSV